MRGAFEAPAFRQASEQYFTSAQFFAQDFRQVMGRAHAWQILVGRNCLFPLKSRRGGEDDIGGGPRQTQNVPSLVVPWPEKGPRLGPEDRIVASILGQGPLGHAVTCCFAYSVRRSCRRGDRDLYF